MAIVDDLFNALFYGSGMWVGLLIVVGLVTVLMVHWKPIIIVTIPLSLFFSLSYVPYLTQANTAPKYVWMFIMLLFFTVVQALYGVTGKGKH